jgi:hypothetical protein
MNIIRKVLKKNKVEEGVINLVQGNHQVGQWMAMDHRLNLISATEVPGWAKPLRWLLLPDWEGLYWNLEVIMLSLLQLVQI